MNIVGILGRVVMDPVIRTTSNNKKVANVVMVVARAGDYDAANSKTNDGFFQIEAWGTTAELIENHVTKGKMISISGNLKQHKWTDDQDNKREQIKIVATSIGFLPGTKVEAEENSSIEEYDPFADA